MYKISTLHTHHEKHFELASALIYLLSENLLNITDMNLRVDGGEKNSKI